MPNRTYLLVQHVKDLWPWATTTGVSTHVGAQIGKKQAQEDIYTNETTHRKNLQADKDGLWSEGRDWLNQE